MASIAAETASGTATLQQTDTRLGLALGKGVGLIAETQNIWKKSVACPASIGDAKAVKPSIVLKQVSDGKY
jgi:hypothetical protein